MWELTKGVHGMETWIVTLAALALIVGLGWWTRRPARERATTRAQLGPRARGPRLSQSASKLRRPGQAEPDQPVRQLAPDDDEEFLRYLSRRYPGPGPR